MYRHVRRLQKVTSALWVHFKSLNGSGLVIADHGRWAALGTDLRELCQLLDKVVLSA